MKKKIIMLVSFVLFASTVIVAHHNHTVRLEFGDTVVDSVWFWELSEGVPTGDTVKVSVFAGTCCPLDTFINIGDTAETKIIYLFWFAGDAGTARSSWEIITGNPRGGYIDSSLEGISNPNRILTIVIVDSSGTIELIPGADTDLKNAALTTLQKRSGSPVVFSVNDATFTLVTVAGGYTCDTSVVVVTGNQEDTVYCYDNFDPGAAAGVDFVRVYLDVGKVHIDTLTGSPIPIKNAKFFVDIVGNPIAISGDWFLPPLTYEGKTNAAGRVFWDLPATTKMTPDGIYYVLRYEASSGRRKKRGVLGKFAVDTLPDPLQVVEAIKVWGASE